MKRWFPILLLCLAAYLCVREVTRAWITVAAIEQHKIDPFNKTTTK